ncbi:glycoside hydrolase 43 family protein [Citrobacter sp. Cb031]|uniref:glycoside hydrolase family 43 protein n=1 Tax=Citrobacter sp. Cb031 TaxID=2985025 RepID=UPI00257EBA46|nr:glycoside hydrolase 43 family protein [Citrobacter sp. Cb031]MDM3464460.1 glycoside hydrolase 43 family protein [Citrobacter sp. Cb031]
MTLLYQNPIIHADYADPDVIRTGDDFWMVASSFNQLPGLPLLHSRDLIHWRIVNYIVKRLPSPEYDIPQPGKGVWAPSIRFHNNRFWVFYSLPDDGIFVTHAYDPMGEWSEPHCLKAAPGWIDPCPLWDDDGRAWLVNAFAFSRSGIKNKLQLTEMAPDASRLLGEGCVIFDGTPSHPTLEGPKLYKRNGEYWIFAPAGGVKRGWQTVMRSQELTGPWQYRDALHQGSSIVNGPHQGAWVELMNGQSWFFHFQDKGVYGRIVHLQPMCWSEDGWPCIGEKLDEHGKGQPVLVQSLPTLPLTPCELQTSDNFLDGIPGLQWQWQSNPQQNWLRPGAQGLHLRSVPAVADLSIYHLPHLLLQKFPAERFTVSTLIDLSLSLEGDEGGVVIYGQRFAALCVKCSTGRRQLIFRHGWINDNGYLDETSLTLADVTELEQVELSYHVDYGGLVRFTWCSPGRTWQQVEPGFSAGAGKWIGARMGIYARGALTGGEGAFLFKSFRIITE